METLASIRLFNVIDVNNLSMQCVVYCESINLNILHVVCASCLLTDSFIFESPFRTSLLSGNLMTKYWQIRNESTAAVAEYIRF